MWQIILTYAIVAWAFGSLLRSIWSFFSNKTTSYGQCASGCGGSCALKTINAHQKR